MQPWPALGQCWQGAPGGPVGRPKGNVEGIMSGCQPGPAPRILTNNNILGDMSQGLGRAPVLPEPGVRHRVLRAKLEHLVRHWDQSMQIERARLAHSHPGDSAFVATANGFSQLPGQHPCSGHAQCARLRGRWRHQQVEDILLHAVEIDLPGDDPAPAAARRKAAS